MSPVVGVQNRALAVSDAATQSRGRGTAGGAESRGSRVASILESLSPVSRLQGWSQALDGNWVTENPVLPDSQARWGNGMGWKETPGGGREHKHPWPRMESGATGGGLRGLLGLVSAGIALSLASRLRCFGPLIIFVFVFSKCTSEIKNLFATRAERGWESVSRSFQAGEIVFLGRYFLVSLKMCKNSAGPCFLCVPGAPSALCFPRRKWRVLLCLGRFLPAPGFPQVLSTWLPCSFLVPRKV